MKTDNRAKGTAMLRAVSKRIVPLLLVHFFAVTPLLAQGEAALPFLLTSPSAAANGMGETSVGLYRDEPLNVLNNPAHLGMFSRSRRFSAGYDYSDWLPRIQQSDLTFKTFGFAAGVNLRRQFGLDPEISIGVSYSRIRLNLGEFSETSPDGPDVISTFDAYETADNYSVGVGLHTWVNLSAGYTLKHVNSVLAPFNVQGQDRQGVASVPAYDLGFFMAIPVMEIAGRIRSSPVAIADGLFPVLNLSAGLAKNNMGNTMVIYIDPDQGDPLPRYARAGVGVELGVSYGRGDLDWRPFMFSWTRESNDLLVRRYPAPVNDQGMIIGDPPPADYRGGLGDIRIFDDLFLGKPNDDVIIKRGWQLELLEFVSLRGGRFLEAPERGNRRFTTSGYTLRLAGVVKFLRALDVPLGPDNLFASILTHLDVRYNHSQIDSDELNHPLNEREFSAWTVILSPWD